MIFASLGDLVSEVGGPADTQVRVAADLCMTAPTQVMVADITIPGQQAGMLQLRGTLVATTSSLGEQGGFFRGAIVPLSPVSGALSDLPTDFVGEVSCQTAASTCSLTIALVSDPSAATSTSSTTSTTTAADSSGTSSGSGDTTAGSGTGSSGTTATTTPTQPSDGGSGTTGYGSGSTSAPTDVTTYPQPTQWPSYLPPSPWFGQAVPTPYAAAPTSS